MRNKVDRRKRLSELWKNPHGKRKILRGVRIFIDTKEKHGICFDDPNVNYPNTIIGVKSLFAFVISIK